MLAKLIPLKNIIFDDEKLFLEDKASKGLYLRKKGLFFYYFTKENPSNVAYEIILEKRNSDTIEMDEWILVASKKIAYKKLIKKYYISKQVTSRLLCDEDQMFGYYKYNKQATLGLSNIFIFPLLLMLTLWLIPIHIPALIVGAVILMLIPFVISSKANSIYAKEVKKISMERGVLTGEEPYYLLQFKKLNDKQKLDLEKAVRRFGYVKKINEYSFKLKSPVPRNELLSALVEELEISENLVSLVNLGDLYIMS